jgi:hypothetical protein
MVEVAKSWLPVAALTAVLMSCGGGAGPEHVLVRDSAGIRIIENAVPEWSEGTGWTVEPEPWLDIGLADGDSAFLFSRIAGIAELETGEVVVADGGSSQIRVFDTAGRHLRSFGRPGEGPGEFRLLLDLLGRSGDTLFLNDYHREIEAYGTDGTYRGTTRFEAVAEYVVASPVARFPDGTHLRATSPQSYPIPPGRQQWTDSTTFLLHEANGALRGEVARRPMIVFNVDAEVRGGVVSYLGPIGSVAGGKDRIYYSYPDDWNIEVRSPDGALTQLIRRRFTPVPITSEMQAAARAIFARQLESASISSEQIQRLLERMPFASTLTAHARMIVDDEGALWVNEADAEAILAETAPLTGVGHVWSVFTADGRWLGRVQMPSNLTVLAISANSVAGTARDELDVEHVRLHRLTR